MSATGQSIVNDALIYLALMDPAGTPSASDSTTLLQVLNNMWEAWGIDEGLIYAIVTGQFPLTAFVQSYTIGTGATYDTPRPARIYKAFAISIKTFTATTTATSKTIAVTDTTGLTIGQGVTGTGIAPFTTILAMMANTSITVNIAATASGTVTLTAIGLNRNELKIVEAGQYYSHNDLGATAATPEEIYPDYNVDASGFARLYVWPAASEFQPSYLEIDQAVNFTTWTLTDNYQIPQAYRDALGWALAFRALPIFGEAVGQGAAEVVAAEGAKAEARLRTMNSKNRQIPEQQMMTPGAPQEPQEPQRAA